MYIVSLSKLLPESPDTERHQNESDCGQRKEVRPKRFDPAALEHAGPRDYAEVIDRVDLCEWLHPARHRFHGGDGAGQARKGRVDEETRELRLFRRFRQRRNERSYSDTTQ